MSEVKVNEKEIKNVKNSKEQAIPDTVPEKVSVETVAKTTDTSKPKVTKQKARSMEVLDTASVRGMSDLEKNKYIEYLREQRNLYQHKAYALENNSKQAFQKMHDLEAAHKAETDAIKTKLDFVKQAASTFYASVILATKGDKISMSINFNSLPSKKPYGAVTGPHYATIIKAEMRKAKDPSKPEYLSLEYQLSDKSGAAKGKLYDLITEPTKDFTKYKLFRFLKALNLVLEGDFELKDISKIVVGKRFIVDVIPDDKGYNSVDVRKNEIYYGLDEEDIAFGTAEEVADPIAAVEDDVPFDVGGNDEEISADDATDY